jgi:hypothetical protein
MKNKIHHLAINFLFLFIFLSSTIKLAAQLQQQNPIIDSAFSFKDGIYANYNEFKNNNPSKKYTPVVLSPGEVNRYIAEHPGLITISSSGQYIWVGHFKTDGEFVRIPPDSIWGFSKDNKVVIKHDESLVNLSVIGAICYFEMQDALFTDELKNSNKNQFVFEFETGKIKRFKRDVILSILSKDMELYQQFLAQDSYKKMTESMYEYLLRYNQQNPVYFPE